MENTLKHYKITVTGKVQGVYYRKSCEKQAIALGIKGYVKNHYNGDVYIEAEGPKNALKDFLVWCESGPTNARVDALKINEDKLQHYEQFIIRYV